MDKNSEIKNIPTVVANDTIKKKDTIALPKESLEDVLRTKADFRRRDFPNKMIYLNQNAQVKYQDMQIDADYISIDEEKNLVYARGKLDSLGKYKELVQVNQGGKKYEVESFNYNTKTKQAMAYNARTEESEGLIVAERTKKYNDSVFVMRHAEFTTDK